MPIPSKRQDESSEEFIERCMADDVMKEEYPDRDQRYAVCSQQIGNARGLVSADIVSNSRYVASTHYMGSEKCLVAPVTIMVEGEHCGSAGPLFYEQDILQSYAEQWDMVPLALNHPRRGDDLVSIGYDSDIYDGHFLGWLRNTYYEETTDGVPAIKGYAWFSIDRLLRLSPNLYARVLDGNQIEVSTGLFHNVEGNRVVSMEPDHLAILPHAVGACSVEDGCGIRVNAKGGDAMDKEKKKDVALFYHIPDIYKENVFAGMEGKDYSQIMDIVHRSIDEMDIENEKVNYVRKVYDDYVIYFEQNRNREDRLLKREYSLSENGDLSWESDPVPVREKVSYEEIGTATSSNEETETEVTNDMSNDKKKDKELDGNEEVSCCPEKVQTLIDNEVFSEDDREYLKNQSEEKIDKWLDLIADNEEGTSAETEEKIQSVNELPENLSPELREGIEYGQKLLNKRKGEFKKTILDNTKQFTNDELDKMDFNMLEKVANAIKKPVYLGEEGEVDFSANEQAPLEEVTMDSIK